jgi:hypothetical protein
MVEGAGRLNAAKAQGGLMGSQTGLLVGSGLARCAVVCAASQTARPAAEIRMARSGKRRSQPARPTSSFNRHLPCLSC